jgi:superfamily I DNA/RNA helicase
MGMMLEIVKEYGNDIYDIIKNIKEKHVPNDEKEKADYIFSTVHRCKGMEYDQVELINDFINEKKLENKLREDRAEGKEPDFTKLNEEINLLYVAVTRTKNKLVIPETLMPKDFAPSVNIDVMKVLTKEDKKIAKEMANKPKAYKASIHNDKADWFDDNKAMPKESFLPWTVSQDKKLRLFCDNGVSVSDIAKHFDRTQGAIIARMKKLDLS